MKFNVQRASLLKLLQMICGVVERRQTLPILANVLLVVKENQLSLTGTDLEIELIGTLMLENSVIPGKITVSAKKLLDICRALPETALLEFTLEKDHLVIRSEKSRFMLTTLPAVDFPTIENSPFNAAFQITQNNLKSLLGKTYFAMGQQDVRHYLNGALLDVHQGIMKCVTTDGHRLAFSSINGINTEAKFRIILPRKSVLELMRLLDVDNKHEVTISIGENHFQVIVPDFTFTSKLINAQYPDYERLIPRGSTSHMAIASRELLKQALARASILSNEKFRGIRLHLDHDLLRIVANNPEQEEAEELIHINYQGPEMEIGFNVAYLLDVVSTTSSENICWSFTDPNGGVLIEAEPKDGSLYVVMPMRL